MIRALLLAVVLGLAAGAAESPDPIREHLRGLEAPWYDTAKDDWRRIEIPQPPIPEQSSQETGDLGMSLFGWVVLALVVTAVALLVADLLRQLRHRAGGSGSEAEAKGRPAPRPIDLSTLPFQVDESSDPAHEAEAAFAAGDWTRAVIWTYVLQLLRLDQAGVIHLGPGATDRGCLRQARAAAAEGRPAGLAEHLERTVSIFERAYFGHQPATRAEAEEVRAGLAAIGGLLVGEDRRR